MTSLGTSGTVVVKVTVCGSPFGDDITGGRLTNVDTNVDAILIGMSKSLKFKAQMV